MTSRPLDAAFTRVQKSSKHFWVSSAALHSVWQRHVVTCCALTTAGAPVIALPAPATAAVFRNFLLDAVMVLPPLR